MYIYNKYMKFCALENAIPHCSMLRHFHFNNLPLTLKGSSAERWLTEKKIKKFKDMSYAIHLCFTCKQPFISQYD